MYSISKLPKNNKTIISLFIALFFIIGCPQMMPPETVDFVDVERYTGLWYQIASYFNPNIGDLAGVTAEYTLNQDGTVKVVNKGFVGSLDGNPVMIEGVARVVDEKTNAKLAVSFPEFGITEESEYWIIELGEYYSYAVVTNSQRSSLFILNRGPSMDDATYQGIIDRLTMQGFDPESIILTPQFDEMPPPETVEFVDVERFTGLWYQIARYFNPAEGELAGVTAEYSLNDDGTLGVLNSGLVGGLNGDPVTIEGFARVVDTDTNAKLAVSFTQPAVDGEFEFWIIELGEYYSYAVISNSMRSTLYIISRTPTIEDSVYQDLLYELTRRGFDPNSIILTPQFDGMAPPETVDFVDIDRYVGLWYEIARYPTPFDEDGVAVTAEYTLNKDGTVGILNSALVGSFDGDPTSIEGTAQVVDEETNAKLVVTFDREDIAGIEFDYWIIELDEDYEWAVVTNATRFVLYILSRTPTLEDTVYEDLLYRVVKKGFDANRLELTPQLDE